MTDAKRSRYVVLRLTHLEADSLWHAATSIVDDVKEYGFDPAGISAYFRALDKLEKARADELNAREES